MANIGTNGMDAPRRFCEWMSTHIAPDHKFGRACFRYHPRSDAHSRALCRFVIDDLRAACGSLSDHVACGEVVAHTNLEHRMSTGKLKSLDLAIGTPAERPGTGRRAGRLVIDVAELRVSCEAKQCMTEHGKTQPRLFDELSSSHEIVHRGNRRTIAAGVVVLNIATRYVSPTRQVDAGAAMEHTHHRQPDVTASMVRHLRGLQRRSNSNDVGFDALAIVVISCDNLGPCTLHTDAPAPQPGDPDHYATFVRQISEAYVDRFAEPSAPVAP